MQTFGSWPNSMYVLLDGTYGLSCVCRVKAAVDNMQTHACGSPPIKLCLQIQVTGWIGPVGLSLPSPASGHKSLKHKLRNKVGVGARRSPV